jgi:uncharacterized protein YggL (DUF469 family)
MNKRIRKKHGVGEFRGMCFTLTFTLADRLSDDDVQAFLGRFAASYLEPRGLACGGGGGREWEVVVSGAEGGSATEADRTAASAWLAAQADVCEVEVGPLVEAWDTEPV